MPWNFQRPVAGQIFVDGSYAGPETGTAAKPYRTISAALVAAREGYVIRVGPGLYRENVTLKKYVGVVARTTGAAIIHGGARPTGGYPTVVGADEALLEGFVITGGYSGVRCDDTSPTLSRNIVRGNYGTGGIVCLRGSKAVLVNNTVLGNLGKLGIGIYAEASSPLLRNNVFAFNGIGFAPYKASPDSDYNDFWDNRKDFGYDARPGAHDLRVNPKFRSTAWDDYRLAPGSPCAGVGDPDPLLQSTDRPTVDLGAFQGDGGYLVGPATQEYFVECVLGAVPEPGGSLRINGTSRFTANPVFWFETGRGTQGEADARRVITEAVPELTAGRFTAAFRDDPAPPPNPCAVVTVQWSGARGEAFRTGAPGPNCRDFSHAIERRGAAITGGELEIPSPDIAGFIDDWSAVSTLRHELGHVAGLAHGFRGDMVMAYGKTSTPDLARYQPQELEAFSLLYQYPPATTLATLIQARKLLWSALQPFPHIDRIVQVTPVRLEPITSAKPEDAIVLQGSRLTMRMMSESNVSDPAASVAPEVYFGDVVVVPDLNDRTTYQGGPARFLKVYVPRAARSGWVFVKAHGLESNPVWLEIT
jgi:hypothetical protein